MGEVCESTSRLVTRPDSPNAEAFFIVKTMSHNSTNDLSLDRAVRIIHTISELDTAFSKAEVVAVAASSRIAREFSESRHNNLVALGHALHQQLSKLYEK